MRTVHLPANAGEFPKSTAARLAMTDIAQKYVDLYTEELSKLSPEDKLRRKALNIQKHMAEHCHTFAALGYNSSTWEIQLEKRSAMLKRAGILAAYESALKSLSPDDRGAFIQYAHTNWFLHNAFIDQHIAHFRAVSADGHPEKAFDDRIILGTVYAICREWRQWWLENGTLSFEEWTYEDLSFLTDETEEKNV